MGASPGLGAELVEVADQGVDEAVVIVDHEDGGHPTVDSSPGAKNGATAGNTQKNRA